MTQPIHLIGSTFAVEVPEDAHGLDINKYGNGSELNYWLIAGAKETLIVIDLPAGNWEIICTTKEATNANLAEIYGYPFIGDDYAQGTLNALLVSKGLDPDKTLIIKKVS